MKIFCAIMYVIILGRYHLCYHLMLSFLTVSKCYHFYVIIFPSTCWMLSFMLSFDVIIFDGQQMSANFIIFMLSFFLVPVGCYHLCYLLMLSFIVIISPLFSFSWKRDTLLELLIFNEELLTSARRFHRLGGTLVCLIMYCI